MNRTVEQRAMRKVYWRILPFTGLLYLICYIDRVNVGFAALTMRQDLYRLPVVPRCGRVIRGAYHVWGMD